MVRIFWWCLTDLYSFIWGCADCCVGGGGTRLRRLIDSETSRNINRLSPWHSGTKSQKNVQSRVLLFKSHCCQYSRFNAHYEFLMIADDQALIQNYTNELNKNFHQVIVCVLLVYSSVRVVVVSNRMDWTFLRMKTFIDQILTIWVVRVRQYHSRGMVNCLENIIERVQLLPDLPTLV